VRLSRTPSLSQESYLPKKYKTEMVPADNLLVVAYLNCHGQTGFNLSKQLQIEDFIKVYEIDILHLQETFIEDDTFSEFQWLMMGINGNKRF
jgi:hypothetical protein